MTLVSESLVISVTLTFTVSTFSIAALSSPPGRREHTGHKAYVSSWLAFPFKPKLPESPHHLFVNSH